MADFSPVEAFTKKYGPFPGYVWFGIIAIVAFFWMRTQQSKAGTLNEDSPSGDGGESEFTSSTESDDGKGNKSSTSSTIKGGAGGGWAFGQPIAGPMGYSAGDVYVNLPGGGTEVKNNQTYKVGTGETLHTIARKLFGDSAFWRDLYRANAELIGEDPWIDLAGKTLVIPDGATQPTDGIGFDIPKYSETSKSERHTYYDKYKKEPKTLAKILNKWADENQSKNPGLAKSQRDWANKLIGN
jgi:hypothetical protein